MSVSNVTREYRLLLLLVGAFLYLTRFSNLIFQKQFTKIFLFDTI